MRAGLLGRKLGHSFSPRIHSFFGDYSYSLFEVEPEQLDTFMLGNAFDAMNEGKDYKSVKELRFGIYSKPEAVLITVDDTGCGMDEEELKLIFEKGYSTKGEGRGTGLWQIKAMVENFGGKITVESQRGAGSSFAVSFGGESKNV
jgi:sensor histidine kinase regulating citrate/malate metabolism